MDSVEVLSLPADVGGDNSMAKVSQPHGSKQRARAERACHDLQASQPITVRACVRACRWRCAVRGSSGHLCP